MCKVDSVILMVELDSESESVVIALCLSFH